MLSVAASHPKINISNPSQSHLGTARRLSSRQRMHSPASCAACCAIPIADESSHSAAGTLHPHRSATRVLYVTLCCPILPSKKIAPSLTGDINPQSSHWNNGKMKIFYNPAYVQRETLNFIFARRAVIVYFIFVPTSMKSLCRMPNINVQADYFLPIMPIVH